jgi:hypothetical protein
MCSANCASRTLVTAVTAVPAAAVEADAVSQLPASVRCQVMCRRTCDSCRHTNRVRSWGGHRDAHTHSLSHLPLGSSPCMLPTYLKLGSGSAWPGLSDISNTHRC